MVEEATARQSTARMGITQRRVAGSTRAVVGTAMVVAVVATVTTAATAREAQRRADAAVLSRLREASWRRRRVPRTRAWR